MRIGRRRFLQGTGATAAALVASPYVQPVWAQQSGPVRLGFVGPLSGAQQIVGTPMRIGAEIARDQINRAGGIGGRQIELVVRDDRGDPTQSVAAARELTSSGVNLVLGIPLTATAMAVTGVMPSLGGVYIATGTGEESLTHQLFNRHFFTVLENNYTRNRSFARFAAQRYPEVTTWIGIFPDVTVGHEAWRRVSSGLRQFYPEVARREVTLADPILTRFGATEFRTQIASLLSSPATGLFSILFGNDGITFFQQARQLGLDRKFRAIGEQALDVDLPKALRRGMPDNTWTLSFWFHGAHTANPLSAALVQEWTQRTNDANPHGFVAPGHTAVRAYAAAIAAAGTTETNAVINALENVRLDTVKGPLHFRKEDHQAITSMNLVNFIGREADPGFEAKEHMTIDTTPIVNPPSPGTAIRI